MRPEGQSTVLSGPQRYSVASNRRGIDIPAASVKNTAQRFTFELEPVTKEVSFMTTGRVLSAKFGDVNVLKFVGSIGYTDEWTFPLSKSLRGYVDELFQLPVPGSSILVDLTEATGMDSTNLGLLAELGKRCKSVFGTKPTIIAQHGRVMNVLRTMSFQSLFTILDVDTPIRGDLDVLPDVPDSQIDVAHMILGAHRNLVELSEGNRDRFQIVVEAIEDDLRRKGRI